MWRRWPIDIQVAKTANWMRSKWIMELNPSSPGYMNVERRDRNRSQFPTMNLPCHAMFSH